MTDDNLAVLARYLKESALLQPATTKQLPVNTDPNILLAPNGIRLRSNSYDPDDIVDWAQHNFYVPETLRPIKLEYFQKLILRHAFDREFAAFVGCPAGFQTFIYSTIKKSGKTTISSVVARWIAETWGSYNEVYSMANDLEQARGRMYAKLLQSIELTPGFDKAKRMLPDRWRIIERDALNLDNGSTIKAVSSDYKGEAGSNPTATFWSELWGYTSETSQRMWAELTPVPTRARSIRWIETYAGFENESTLLLDQWELATKEGRRLTRDEVPLWPFDGDIPLWVNPAARLFAYIDQGDEARHMPWQLGPEGLAYYESQAATLLPSVYNRLHRNLWVSSVQEFIPIEWWDRARAGFNGNPPLPLPHSNEPVVLAADASVTGDCTALVGVTRDPRNAKNIAVRFVYVWYPSPSNPMDYDVTLKEAIIDLCRRYNIVQLTYDQFQLHHLMNEIRQEGYAWCVPFDQGAKRMQADKQLFDIIREKRIIHNDPPAMRDHIRDAAASVNKSENTKLRIVKKSRKSRIDVLVALSMAAYECLRLNI